MHGSYALALGLAGAALVQPLCAQAQEHAVNPAPTQKDWSTIGALPDLSGVWTPGPIDRFAPGSSSAPPWKPKQAEQIAALKKLDEEGRPRNIYTNCLPEGLPSSVTQTLNSLEFLVTPGRVTILGEFDGNRLRRVWTDGRGHPPDPDPTFSGHSTGRWDNGVLLIDTVGILPQVFIPMAQGVGLPNNGDMRVEERIELTGHDALLWTIIVHAPKALSGPWKATRTFTRHRGREYDLVESSCRQGDFFDDVDAEGNAVFTPIPKDAGGAPVPPDQPTAPVR